MCLELSLLVWRCYACGDLSVSRHRYLASFTVLTNCQTRLRVRSIFRAANPTLCPYDGAGLGPRTRRMTQVVLRGVLTLTFGVLAFACSEQSPSQSPTSPSATSATADHSSYGSDTVRARLRSHAEGLRAVSYGTVWYSVDGGRVRGGRVNIELTSGRYTISALSTGSRVRLTAFSGDLQQTCAVYTVFEAGDTVQDIKLVRSGTHDATCDGPTLSGVVFRLVEGEMRPLKGQRVGFYSAESGGVGRIRDHQHRGPFRILRPLTRSRIPVSR